MKKLGNIFLAILLLKSAISFSQDSAPMTDSLAGTWYLTNPFPITNDSLVYERISAAPYNWGDRIEFNAPQIFVDAYSAKCGNDERIHNDSGTWIFLNGSIIVTSIPISVDQGTKHKILSLTADKLILKKLN